MTLLTALLALSPAAQAFCGTYVSSAGADTYNTSSQVVIGRVGNRTTLTMTSDIRGPSVPTAMVVPVPPTLAEGDFVEVDPELVERIGSYSAPRLVAYDCDTLASTASVDPGLGCSCSEIIKDAGEELLSEIGDFALDAVEVKANFLIGQQEVYLLDATASGALVTWLEDAGFQVPDATADLLDEYVQAGSHFLVADMTLDLGGNDAAEEDYVTPLQFSYDSPNLTLPIKLGTANSTGEQHLTVYVIGDGQARITNYEEKGHDGGECMPREDDFPIFYEEWVNEQLDGGDEATWITEYAWAPVHCDPCTDYPLTQDEVEAFGYTDDAEGAFFTRMHMRFRPAQAKDDLQIQLLGGDNQQVRFIEYLEELESDFPVCFEGFAKNPGSCDDVQTTTTARVNATSRGRTTGGLLALLGLGLLVRRKRTG
ncbi:MAG: hypothetical protein ACI8PZ_004740 [Myxococcota bacterium]|jgi:hypothetical protein